jgi:hypothetical protein
VAKRKLSVYRGLVLFVAALFAPFMVGFQYLEWRAFPSSSTHMTWVIATGIGIIENSDWTEGVWILKPVISLVGLAILLLPRVFFAAVASMHDAGKLGRYAVFVSAFPIVFVSGFVCLSMMTANIILGIPPGVLVSVAAPTIDFRLFTPTPILIVLGLFIVRSKNKKQRSSWLVRSSDLTICRTGKRNRCSFEII